MSDIELGSVISLIMENPDLVAEIKRLAEKRSSESKDEPVASVEKNDAEEIKVTEEIKGRVEPPPRRGDIKGKRSELLHALAPYISEGRQKALETFMTIADILDMMREK